MPTLHSIDRIRAAIHQLLTTEGADSLSFRSVAKRAGLSIGTVGYYFTNRASLLKFALEPHDKRVTRVVDSLRPAGGVLESAAALTRLAFAHRGEVRMQMLCFVQGWRVSHINYLDAALGAASGVPMVADETERRAAALVLGLGVQHLAAMCPDALAQLLDVDGSDDAEDVISDAVRGMVLRLLHEGPKPQNAARG